MSGNEIVNRLAPSPTGLLHLGHAHTFILAWLHARSRGGKVLLRMEDLDRSRSKPGLAQSVAKDLLWLGLDWDGPVISQHQTLPQLSDTVDALLGRGLAYPCVCTRADLENAQSAPHRGEQEVRYPGTCRGRFETLAQARNETGRAAAIRLKVEPGRVEFVDHIAGLQSVDVFHDIGDFVIANRAQVPGYHLAVVANDHAQGVTEVFRGNDLLASTARQKLVFQAIGAPCPEWYHAPLVVDQSGRRLAKRCDDLSLAELRDRGVAPGRITAWVAQCFSEVQRSVASPEQLLTEFSLRGLRVESVCAPNQDWLLKSD